MDSTFLDRMFRAARLDTRLYEEVERDSTANGQAIAVVVLAAVAAGIGSGGASLFTLFVASVAALVGWYVWALLTWLIGTQLLPESATQASHGELLRTIAFSSAPGILRVIGIVPFLRGILFLITGIWMLVAMVVAVRQALDYESTGRAVGVCIIGWFVQIVIVALVLALVSSGHQPP